ncbi:hypothetical protein PV326_008012, partial [Microctonus aethiopoides]
KCLSLVPAAVTLHKDEISSPTASERYLGRKQERFLSLVPAVRIVRVHVMPSTADSKHASDTERLVAGLVLPEAEQPMNCALRARAAAYVAAAGLSHSAAYVAQERTAHLPLPSGVQWGILGIRGVVGLAGSPTRSVDSSDSYGLGQIHTYPVTGASCTGTTAAGQHRTGSRRLHEPTLIEELTNMVEKEMKKKRIWTRKWIGDRAVRGGST